MARGEEIIPWKMFSASTMWHLLLVQSYFPLKETQSLKVGQWLKLSIIIGKKGEEREEG
jgi:hypothetical protein